MLLYYLLLTFFFDDILLDVASLQFNVNFFFWFNSRHKRSTRDTSAVVTVRLLCTPSLIESFADFVLCLPCVPLYICLFCSFT